MTRGDLVIANSDYTRDHVLAEHQLDPGKLVTIPRGVDLERFDPRLVHARRGSRPCARPGASPATTAARASCWPAG